MWIDYTVNSGQAHVSAGQTADAKVQVIATLPGVGIVEGCSCSSSAPLPDCHSLGHPKGSQKCVPVITSIG